MTISKSQYTRTCARYQALQRKKPRSPKLRIMRGIIYACIVHGLWQQAAWAFEAAQVWRINKEK